MNDPVSEAEVNAVVRGVMQVSLDKATELDRTIARVLSGDQHEMVRAIVQRVTDAIELRLCHLATETNQTLIEDMLDVMIDAKYEAFEEITGREFETQENRMMDLRREIRNAAKNKQS